MMNLVGPIFSFIGRNALRTVSRSRVANFGRDVVRDLLISALVKNITSSSMQSRFALGFGSRDAILDTQAGQVELITRVMEAIRERENRNDGAAYLAESLAVHAAEGGKQRTTSLLAMQAAAADDLYYPLLVYATNINSRPVSNPRECALFAACLYANWYSHKQYVDTFGPNGGKTGDDANAVRDVTLEDRTTWQWLGNTWIFWNDTYSKKIGQIADEMENNPSWLRIGSFIMILRQYMMANAGLTALPKMSKYDSVAILNMAIDTGCVSMADDRQALHNMNMINNQQDAMTLGKDMNYPYFKAAFLTSVSVGAAVTPPGQDTLANHLATISRLSHHILDPALRLDLALALRGLAEDIRRDVA